VPREEKNRFRIGLNMTKSLQGGERSPQTPDVENARKLWGSGRAAHCGNAGSTAAYQRRYASRSPRPRPGGNLAGGGEAQTTNRDRICSWRWGANPGRAVPARGITVTDRIYLPEPYRRNIFAERFSGRYLLVSPSRSERRWPRARRVAATSLRSVSVANK